MLRTTGDVNFGSISDRHKIGLEYAFDNDVFQEELQKAVIVYGASVGGVPPKFSSTLLSIKEQFERDRKSITTGKNFNYWYETMLEVIGVVLPDIGLLDAAKVAVAFATAYIYGFFFG